MAMVEFSDMVSVCVITEMIQTVCDVPERAVSMMFISYRLWYQEREIWIWYDTEFMLEQLYDFSIPAMQVGLLEEVWNRLPCIGGAQRQCIFEECQAIVSLWKESIRLAMCRREEHLTFVSATVFVRSSFSLNMLKVRTERSDTYFKRWKDEKIKSS